MLSRMKMTAVIATAALGLGVVSVGVAANGNFYAGVNGGWAQSHLNQDSLKLPSWSHANFKRGSAAGGVFAGYNFDEKFAAELGYTYFRGARVNSVKEKGGTEHVNKRMNSDAFSLVGRVNFPINKQFSAFGKGGVAWAKNKDRLHLKNFTTEKSKRRVRPTATLGVAYNISPNVAAEAGYTRIFGNKKYSVDYISAGVSFDLADLS